MQVSSLQPEQMQQTAQRASQMLKHPRATGILENFQASSALISAASPPLLKVLWCYVSRLQIMLQDQCVPESAHQIVS